MFSLIIVIISIVLVVVLVAATMYFGGTEALDKGKDESSVAQILNETDQIRAAIYSHNALQGGWPSGEADLVPSYIKTLPKNWTIVSEEGGGMTALMSVAGADTEHVEKICKMVNEKLKLDLTDAPSCSSVDLDFIGCCLP